MILYFFNTCMKNIYNFNINSTFTLPGTRSTKRPRLLFYGQCLHPVGIPTRNHYHRGSEAIARLLYLYGYLRGYGRERHGLH